MKLAAKLKMQRLRFKVNKRNLLNKKYAPNEEQKLAITLAKRTIVKPDTVLLCSADSEYGSNHKPRYIIRNVNDHIDIRIVSGMLRIKNGILKYDVPFSDLDPNLSDLKAFFARNVERRLDKIEDEMNKEVLESLDNMISQARTKHD